MHAMGFSLAFIAPRDGASATSGKRTTSAATKDREMHRLLTESPPDWARLLLSQGANIEARNSHQETPLITSAGQGNLSLVELLLENHADIHAADAEGNTALHVASFNSRVKVVELLLTNGAKTRVQNTLGFSPLHQAVRRFWEVSGETEVSRAENQRQIVLLLLAHAADPYMEDQSHRTAAVLATESNNVALAALFDGRSMRSGEQATVPSPSGSRPPLQKSSVDTPPQNEPEVRQQVESPAPETPREADSPKTESAVAGYEPIPPSSEPKTAIVPPPTMKPLGTLQPSEPNDPSITAGVTTEAATDSTAKAPEPPTSASTAGHQETTTGPSSPPSAPEKQTATASATSSGEEAHLPVPSTPPAHRPEAGIPHTKAVPDLPKQKSDHGPRTMDQPAPTVQKSDPSHAPPAVTLPTPKPQEGIGALAQAATPREPVLESGQDLHPSPPGPAAGYPVKEPKESSDNSIFRNLGFGLGIGWTHNLGPQRIESANAVNGVVRVDADRNDLVRFMPEVHLWMDQWDDQRWSWGPFLSVAPGSNLIDAIGFGLMLGYRARQTDRYTFNLGIGGTLDFNTRVLGDGLSTNQPLPSGETQVRTKQTTAPGLLIMLSVGWDIGMPRRPPPPGQTP